MRIGQFQIRMNGGQLTKAINDLLGVVIGGMVIQHQLSENLVNAVELLQACCTVEQGEGVGPHFKKAVQLGQIRRLAGVHLQVITVLGQTCQGTRAAAVQLFQPEIQRLPLTLGKEPALLHIASGLAAAIKPEQGPQKYRLRKRCGASLQPCGDACDALAGACNVVTAFIALTAGPAYIADQVAVTFMAAGGRQVVAWG